MKPRGVWLAGILLLSHAPAVHAQTMKDGGGRDVSVALFSTHTVHSVTLTPVGSQVWKARCATCAHESFVAPLHLSAPAELFAGGMLRVRDDASGEERLAAGLWHIRATSQNSAIDVVLTLPSEHYVAAVLNAEAATDEPPASLRALAVLARTYALNGKHFTAPRGHLEADLCDSTQCQAMRLGSITHAVEEAVRATSGETLWFGASRAEVFFSQDCGGTTEDASAVWPTLGKPYLRSHADPYCVKRDTARWHADVSPSALAEIGHAEGWHLPAHIVEARVTDRSASHRALQVLFIGSDGGRANVSASALRFGIGRALGWDSVRSDAYDLALRNGSLVFDGRGHGHGVGLCQVGAKEMAHEGKTEREILEFYFPGTAVRILPSDDGWKEARAGAVIIHATHLMDQPQLGTIERIWKGAQQRFPARPNVTPDIVFTPSTEVFRQMTDLPGWALASTRGSAIVLQPETVLRAQGRDENATLLHEMLHVLVESEATPRAPLWLREGLVEVLAGDPGAHAVSMPADTLNQALTSAQTLTMSAKAHAAAAARTHTLVVRYGMSAVRGWLSTGVPAGVM